jgi:prepilin-type N-terminal cleavage/methylation domain-containing protein
MQNVDAKKAKFKSLNNKTPHFPQKGFHFLLKGFSLIELIVVIMIMALIFGLVTANYRNFGRRQVLVGAVRQIKGDLRFTQQQALSGRKPETPAGNVCFTQPLRGYVFSYVNATSYQIVANCGPDASLAYRVIVSVIDLSARYPNVQINPFTEIMFRNLGKGVDVERTITVTMPPEPNRIITITRGGEIN